MSYSELSNRAPTLFGNPLQIEVQNHPTLVVSYFLYAKNTSLWRTFSTLMPQYGLKSYLV